MPSTRRGVDTDLVIRAQRGDKGAYALVAATGIVEERSGFLGAKLVLNLCQQLR